VKNQLIYELTNNNLQEILTIVNDAAKVYKGKIPNDRWKEPYMPVQELKREIQEGVHFYGWKEKGALIAVMGMQRVNDVTLIRHAYVLTSHQRVGIGEKLLKYLLVLSQTPKVYVGTWQAAQWAIEFYQKHGFRLVSTQEKNKLLNVYWSIPKRQVETSVVLELER